MPRPEYEPLSSKETGELEEQAVPKFSARRRCLKLVSFANILLWVVTLGTLAWIRDRERHPNAHYTATSSYSPLYGLLDLDPRVKKVNGTLFPPDEQSIARQMPNAVADELWHEIEITRVFPASREDLIKLGKDPRTAVKLEDEVWGQGEEKYAAVLDMFHQLHCLNSLRKVIYGGYYDQVAGDHNKPMRHHEMHINHCMDIMFQMITCSNNLNLITLHWAEGQPGPFPDMSINRQCVNFDSIVQWRKDNTIDMDKWVTPGLMDKPEGHAEMPWGVEIP
ncbi:hypothetical protein F4780DRAFT_774136 [Xylariomycetidae sp. FL0641]|nr:hypothetical protein F4780DRAFT_774136 [Xylariomycetidae sp. FL0641]